MSRMGSEHTGDIADRRRLGIAALETYRRDGTPADLVAAVEILRGAFDAATGAAFAAVGVDLVEALVDMYDRVGRRPGDDHLDQAIAVLERVEVVADHRGRLLLAHALLERYERDGGLGDVHRAAALRRAAGGDDTRSVRLDAAMSYLGVNVPGRVDEASLSSTVTVLRADLTGTPAEHPELAGRLVHLGNALLQRSELPGHEDDLDEAVIHFTAAVVDGPRRGVGRHRWLSNLGNALAIRFERDGDRVDLDRSVELFRSSVAVCPPQSPELPSCLSNLANSLLDRFEQDGDPSDLTAGIAELRAAVKHTPPRSPQRGARLGNLSSGLRLVFDATGELDDLMEAIDTARTALAVVPAESTDIPRLRTNLGNALIAAHDMGSPATLEPAIEAYTQAIDLAGPHDRERPVYVNNLATALCARGGVVSLRSAIALLEEALDATPRPAPRYALQLNNLANALTELYELTGRRRLLSRAARLYRRALLRTPRHAPEYASWSYNLASTTATRQQLRRVGFGARRLRALYRRTCAIAAQTSPDTHLAAARSWARWAERRGSWGEAAGAYRQATAAVRALVELQLLLPQKHQWLRGSRDLTVRSAYAHLRAGQTRQAVLEVERGRALQLSEVLEHAALARFAARAGSPLADRMHRLAAQGRALRLRPTNRPAADFDYGRWNDDAATDIDARRRLRADVRHTVADIRRLAAAASDRGR